MSAEKRRNMLFSFAAIVIALLAVVAYVSPRFRTEDASGAIGAVQKHRAPQIQRADVVLGSEAVKKEQKVAYGDYLTDAAALQNISADVAMAARSNEARSSLESTRQNVGVRSTDLQARYLVAARDEAAALEAVARNLNNARASAILSRVQADVQNRVQINAQEMDALNARLAEAAQALESRNNLQSIADAEAQLAAMEAQLESAKNLDASKLQAIEQQLDARMNARMQSREQYLAAMAKESRSLQSADAGLAALMSRNADAANRASFLSSADALSTDLAGSAKQLESDAVESMQSRLNSEANEIAALGRMSQSLGAMKQGLDSRSNSYEATSLHAFDNALQALSHNVQSRTADAQARAAAEMRGQLDGIRTNLEARQSLDARMGSRLQSETELAARISNRDSLKAFSDQLASLGSRIENRSLASAMPDAQALAAEAQDLANRANGLQSRQQ